jgi:hypothetical protein
MGRVKNPIEINHEVLAVNEICDLLQVHQATVYKLIRQARFRFLWAICPLVGIFLSQSGYLYRCD